MPASPGGAAAAPVPAAGSAPGGGQKVCGKEASTKVDNGAYSVQNNEWGANDGQCITTNGGPGFAVDSGNHNKSNAPAAYPSIVSGCWMSNCTVGTTLPTQISQLGPISSSIAGTIPPGTKSNLAYDIWADHTAKKTGQNDAMELMIWLKETGGIKPIGQKTGTVSIARATWDVYKGTNGVPVISYVRQLYVDSADNLPITDFVKDAVKEGTVKDTDYLTNIQAGFEPWVGGPGLQLTKFSVTNGPGTGAPGAGAAVSGAAGGAAASATGGASVTPTSAPPTSSDSSQSSGAGSSGQSQSSTPSSSSSDSGSGSSGSSSAPQTSTSSPSGAASGGSSSSAPVPAAGAQAGASAGGPTGAVWSLTSGLTGFESTPWNNEGATNPVAAPSPNVPGRQAVKFEVPGGGKRSESQPSDDDFKSGDHSFFGYSGYLAPGFATDDPQWQVIWQLHDNGTNGSPPVALEVGNNSLWLATHGADHDKNLGPVAPGQDVAVQLEVQFTQGGGFVNVWRDGKQVISNYKPPSGTMVDSGDYLKTGIYRDPSESKPSSLYLNDLKIGTTLQSVSNLAGAPPAAASGGIAGQSLPAIAVVLSMVPVAVASSRRRRRVRRPVLPQPRPAFEPPTRAEWAETPELVRAGR